VYEALDTQLQRRVAIKRLLPLEESQDKGDIGRDLRKEAATLSAFQHPNIITVYDIGTDEEGWYVVMELLDGETMEETVSRGALTLNDFTQVAEQILEGLIAAHDQDLLHRDLKPTNIMVTWLPSGKYQVKILDFGLAKFSAKPALQTVDQSNSILGSIYFMAPEQFVRKPLDARTDIYASGCLFYYALTGLYPFDGDTTAGVMDAHLQNKVRPLGELRPDLPAPITDWVMWHLNLSPDDRPPRIQDSLEMLRSVLLGNPLPGGIVLPGRSATTATGSIAAAPGTQEAPVVPATMRVPGEATSAQQMGTQQVGMGTQSVTGSIPGASMATGYIPATGHVTTGIGGTGGHYVGTMGTAVAPPKRKGPILLVGALVLAAIGAGAYLFLNGGSKIPPYDPPSSLAVWLDAERTAFSDSNKKKAALDTPIGYWSDNSPNSGLTPAQAVVPGIAGGAVPKLPTAYKTGEEEAVIPFKTVSFSGENAITIGKKDSETSLDSVLVNKKFTMFLVVNRSGNPKNKRYLLSTDFDTHARALSCWFQEDKCFLGVDKSWATTPLPYAYVGAPEKGFFVLWIEVDLENKNATISTIDREGEVTWGQSVDMPDFPLSISEIKLGEGPGYLKDLRTSRFIGSISELLVFDKLLDDGSHSLDQTKAYLIKRYFKSGK